MPHLGHTHAPSETIALGIGNLCAQEVIRAVQQGAPIGRSARVLACERVAHEGRLLRRLQVRAEEGGHTGCTVVRVCSVPERWHVRNWLKCAAHKHDTPVILSVGR